MEKFIWNVIGVFLIIGVAISLLLCFFTSSDFTYCILGAFMFAGWIYSEKAPVFCKI